jgi:hypothetical protein
MIDIGISHRSKLWIPEPKRVDIGQGKTGIVMLHPVELMEARYPNNLLHGAPTGIAPSIWMWILSLWYPF